MRLRDRIADWLTGGELRRLMCGASSLVDIVSVQRDAWMRTAIQERIDLTTRHNAIIGRHQARTALHAIAAMETPGANATVRRMARTANKALEDAR